MVVPDSCYNLKSPPVFYVQNIKMCIHSEGVRIFSNLIYVLFRGYSSCANQIDAMIQNEHCKRFIFEIIIIFKGWGASCAITCFIYYQYKSNHLHNKHEWSHLETRGAKLKYTCNLYFCIFCRKMFIMEI